MWCVVSFYFFFFFLRCMTDMDSDLPADCVRTGGGRRCQETETGLQAGTGGRLHEPGELRTSFPRAHWDRRQKTRVEKKKNRAVPEHLYIFCFLANFISTKQPRIRITLTLCFLDEQKTGQGAGDCYGTHDATGSEGGFGSLDVLPAKKKPSLLPLGKCFFLNNNVTFMLPLKIQLLSKVFHIHNVGVLVLLTWVVCETTIRV